MIPLLDITNSSMPSAVELSAYDKLGIAGLAVGFVIFMACMMAAQARAARKRDECFVEMLNQHAAAASAQTNATTSHTRAIDALTQSTADMHERMSLSLACPKTLCPIRSKLQLNEPDEQPPALPH